MTQHHDEYEQSIYHAARLATFLCHMGEHETARMALSLALEATAEREVWVEDDDP